MRKNGFRILSHDPRMAYYTHLVLGWTGTVTVYQEADLLNRLENNEFYKWYHPTQWSSGVETYKKMRSNQDRHKRLTRAVWKELFDLMLEGNSVELIPNIIFLRAVTCPRRKGELEADLNFHLTYKSISTYAGRSIIAKYYREKHCGHKYRMNSHLETSLKNSTFVFPSMLSYDGSVHKQLARLK